jgi:hypothetical protein
LTLIIFDFTNDTWVTKQILSLCNIYSIKCNQNYNSEDRHKQYLWIGGKNLDLASRSAGMGIISRFNIVQRAIDRDFGVVHK